MSEVGIVIRPGSIWMQRSYIALSSAKLVENNIIFIIASTSNEKFSIIKFMNSAGLLSSLYISYANFMHEYQHLAD